MLAARQGRPSLRMRVHLCKSLEKWSPHLPQTTALLSSLPGKALLSQDQAQESINPSHAGLDFAHISAYLYRHSINQQLDIYVVCGRSTRVPEHVPCLLTKRFVCCRLSSDLWGGRAAPLCLAAHGSKVSYSAVDKNIRDLVLIGCGTELVVHIKLIV